VTANGKLRSSLNAVKHGLLARRLVPSADFRDDHRLYQQILRELTAEFNPVGFSQVTLVANLAGDYVQLARVRAMLEVLQRPAELAQEKGQRLAMAKGARRDMRLMAMAREALNSQGFVAFDAKQAARLAELVEGQVREAMQAWDSLIQERAEQRELLKDRIGPEPAPDLKYERTPTQAEVFEEREAQQIEKMATLIRPAAQRLRDKSYLEAVFTGRKRPLRPDCARLNELLAQGIQNTRNWLKGEKDIEKTALQLKTTILAKFANSPDQLIVLSKYLGRTEASIERKLRELRRR
jgi:hypothetical protein